MSCSTTNNISPEAIKIMILSGWFLISLCLVKAKRIKKPIERSIKDIFFIYSTITKAPQ
jgi:hypothetical protein